MDKNNSPLIVLAYNRPFHLNIVLTALAQNPEARATDLFVFIDGPKNEAGKEKNEQVYSVAAMFTDQLFRSVTIERAQQNKGLAHAVIDGVTKVISKYGKAIITEDDAVCAPSYLKFMNKALDFYENDDTVWSIGGYTVPMRIPADYQSDVIKTQRSSSYAWATWKDRWEKIDWEMHDYRKFHFDFLKRREFNAWGNDRASMLDDQMNGRVNSWAIRFDYAMFKNGMYNIISRRSLIRNIGHDGSGTHSTTDSSENDTFWVDLKSANNTFVFEKIQTDNRLQKKFSGFFNESRIGLLKRYIGNLLFSMRRNRNGK